MSYTSEMRKTIPMTISFQPDIWDYIKNKNKSDIVNEALREHKKNRLSPEERIKLKKEEIGRLNKKITELKQEIDDIFAMEIRHENPEDEQEISKMDE